MAASAISAGVGQAVGPTFGNTFGGQVATRFTSGLVAQAVTAKGGKINVGQIAADAFGSAIGNAIVGQITQAGQQEQRLQYTEDLRDATMGQVMGVASAAEQQQAFNRSALLASNRTSDPSYYSTAAHDPLGDFLAQNNNFAHVAVGPMPALAAQNSGGDTWLADSMEAIKTGKLTGAEVFGANYRQPQVSRENGNLVVNRFGAPETTDTYASLFKPWGLTGTSDQFINRPWIEPNTGGHVLFGAPNPSGWDLGTVTNNQPLDARSVLDQIDAAEKNLFKWSQPQVLDEPYLVAHLLDKSAVRDLFGATRGHHSFAKQWANEYRELISPDALDVLSKSTIGKDIKWEGDHPNKWGAEHKAYNDTGGRKIVDDYFKEKGITPNTQLDTKQSYELVERLNRHEFNVKMRDYVEIQRQNGRINLNRAIRPRGGLGQSGD